MNAGKSTTLLQSSHNYNERGMDTLLFAPLIDDRYGVGNITTRIGIKAKASLFTKQTNIYQTVEQQLTANDNIRCVLIDEAQFLTKQQVDQLCQITDNLSIPVLTYGLRTDFQGEPFEGSQYLMAWADLLIELKTICHCGRKASMNLRINEQGQAITTGEQIQIGGNESYVATCRRHFKLGQASKTNVSNPNVSSNDNEE